MSLSTTEILGNKNVALTALSASWTAMINFAKSNCDIDGLANLINIIARSHELPLDSKTNEITVKKILKKTGLINNLELMTLLLVEHKFRFTTKSIRELLPESAFESLVFDMDFVSCDDPVFVEYVKAIKDGGTQLLKKMLKKSDNFGACGKILAPFFSSDAKVADMLTYIKSLMSEESIKDIQGTVAELTKRFKNCSAEDKLFLEKQLGEEWKLTLKGKVNQNKKRKTPVGVESKNNKKKTRRAAQDNDDYDDSEDEDNSSDEDDSDEDDNDEDEESSGEDEDSGSDDEDEDD